MMNKPTIIDLKINIKDPPHFNEAKKIVLRISNSNLWFIMMALREDRLADHLQKQVTALSKELYKIGKKEFQWV